MIPHTTLPRERPLRAFLEPIAAELEDGMVTEIVINQPCEVGIEKAGKWTWRTVPEFTYERAEQIGILTCQMAGHDFDADHPIGLATLPDGQRFTICRPPVTPSGTIGVNIRVPSKTTSAGLDSAFDALVRHTNIGPPPGAAVTQQLIGFYRARDWHQFFPLAVRSHKTILATGVTGSGKTSLLKRFMQSIPLHERIVTIEDTNEFGPLPHRNRVSLFYGAAGVTAEDAVKLSLRQRPDRVLMQELRGPEAFGFIRAQMAGHGGGMTTLHAERGADAAFETLAVLVKGHPDGKEIPDEKLMGRLRSMIDIVCWCARDEDGFHMPYVWLRDAEEKEIAQ
jgi:type IV secretion system protein VirB11